MSAATMPDRAAGKTIRSDTCSFVAPMPKAPSRSAAGTADIASSATEAIVGRTRKPMMMPAASALNWLTPMPRPSRRISGVKKVSAKKPKTIVGTPASVSRTGFTILRTRDGAYSAR